MIAPVFESAKISGVPFPHARIPKILPEDEAEDVLKWLNGAAPWRLRIEHFYEQEEFSLLQSQIGDSIKFLVEPSFVDPIREFIRTNFDLTTALTLVDINAHRLTPGQTIRVHNDFIDGEETHRLLIQVNGGWTKEQGGLLMLFSGSTPEEFHSAILPRHRSGFVFEISPHSYHAVSQIKNGRRYTLVYTFRAVS